VTVEPDWVLQTPDPGVVTNLESELGWPASLAATLANRGVTNPDTARRHLSPGLENFHSPNRLPEIEVAIDRIQLALTRGDSIRVYADRDVEVNRQLGEHGATLLDDGDTVMTHCNAGALATVDWGTALGVVYSATAAGKAVSVVANETRPLNQGSRLTTWELLERDVPVTLVPDNASGLCLQQGRVDAVVVGADRIVLDGDGAFADGAVFNKIGTYNHAVLADRHDVPFVVAAPTSTVDAETPAEAVEIEERDPAELREIYGHPNAPDDVSVFNPAFDATPMSLVDYLVTERGVFEPPLDRQLVADA
jgi:methylthioribose-1-phosphate isomerase